MTILVTSAMCVQYRFAWHYIYNNTDIFTKLGVLFENIGTNIIIQREVYIITFSLYGTSFEGLTTLIRWSGPIYHVIERSHGNINLKSLPSLRTFDNFWVNVFIDMFCKFDRLLYTKGPNQYHMTNHLMTSDHTSETTIAMLIYHL